MTVTFLERCTLPRTKTWTFFNNWLFQFHHLQDNPGSTEAWVSLSPYEKVTLSRFISTAPWLLQQSLTADCAPEAPAAFPPSGECFCRDTRGPLFTPLCQVAPVIINNPEGLSYTPAELAQAPAAWHAVSPLFMVCSRPYDVHTTWRNTMCYFCNLLPSNAFCWAWYSRSFLSF